MKQPLVFDIKRYAINDGPGIRIVIFMKGCNLNCKWCHNPESISAHTERMYSASKCIKCGSCVQICPENAITLTQNGIFTNSDLCKMHGFCSEVCPTKAISLSGKYLSVSDLMVEIEKERVFFDQSGGGVTFSGGEPLLYTDFLLEILDECGKQGIHRAIDTAGRINSESLLNVAPRTDLFLFDLKMMDSDKHRQWTGVGNKLILKNLRLLAETGTKIIIRIPLISKLNDDTENIVNTAKFVAELKGDKKEVNLLPYHKIAQTKYQKLGRPNDFIILEEPSEESQFRAIEIFNEFGIKATIS